MIVRLGAKMFRKQMTLLIGVVPAFLIVSFVCLNAARLFSFAELPADDGAERLAFVARWLLVPAITLWIGVQFAGRRGFYPDLIDGTRTPPPGNFEINLRYNTNTLEQVVLAAIA